MSMNHHPQHFLICNLTKFFAQTELEVRSSWKHFPMYLWCQILATELSNLLRWGIANVFFGLALYNYLPNFKFPNNWNYRLESLHLNICIYNTWQLLILLFPS
jgi:hypothetical protein